jgi:hypothetical protein
MRVECPLSLVTGADPRAAEKRGWNLVRAGRVWACHAFSIFSILRKEWELRIRKDAVHVSGGRPGLSLIGWSLHGRRRPRF